MAFLLCLLMALVPFILGKGALCILYGNQPTQEISPADSVLTGGMTVIGLAEAAHLGSCLTGRSFSDCIKYFGTGIGVCLLLSTAVWMWKKKTEEKNPFIQRKVKKNRVKRILTMGASKQEQVIYFLLGICIILQLISLIALPKVYWDGDMTVETVNSFLENDAIYQVNPLTGKEYTVGIPLRLKILCLPTLYAILGSCLGLSGEVVVTILVPTVVLIGSYLAYGTVAKALFPDSGVKRGVFLLLTALLLAGGNYMLGMDGFGLFSGGFRGTTIRAAILLPYTFGLILRKRYKLVVFCILTECCIVWTFYGMGACIAVAVGMFCVRFITDFWAKRRHGKEGRL